MPSPARLNNALAPWALRYEDRTVRSDKEELSIILRAMLEAKEDEQLEDEPTLKKRTQHRGPKGGRGYYQRQIINGCGPTCTCGTGAGENTAQSTLENWSESPWRHYLGY